MSTATGVVFLPQSLADTGVLPLILASFWTSSLKAKILKMEHSEELEFRGKLTVIYRPHLQFYLH